MALDLDNSHLDKLKPLEVKVGEFKSVEAAIKKFRKIVEKEGHIKDAIERRAFTKPSQLKHTRNRQVRRRRELQRREEERLEMISRARARRW